MESPYLDQLIIEAGNNGRGVHGNIEDIDVVILGERVEERVDDVLRNLPPPTRHRPTRVLENDDALGTIGSSRVPGSHAAVKEVRILSQVLFWP